MQTLRQRSRTWLALLVWTLALPSPVLATTPTVPPEALRNALEDLALTATEASNLEGWLDRADFEAEALIQRVKADIAFQPYPGVLKGIRGTLRSGSGNAHDQALTLATLLNEAGFEAQLLAAELTETQRARVLQEVRAADPQSHPKLDPSLAGVMKKLSGTGPTFADHYVAAANRAKPLLASLTNSQQQQMKKALSKEAQQASMDYRWVRYRESSSDPWQEVHPVFEGPGFDNLQATNTETGTVDKDSLQTLSLELLAIDTRGNRTNVLGTFEAPLANLQGEPISLGIGSNATLQENLWTSTDKLLKESHTFFIQLNGTVLPDAKLFDLEGRLLDRTALEGLGTLFDTLSQQGRKAAAALGGAASTRNGGEAGGGASKLERLVLQFTLTAPGTAPVLQERVLYDRQALPLDHPPAAQLLQQWTLSIEATEQQQTAHLGASVTHGLKALDTAEKFQEKLAAQSAGSYRGLERALEAVESTQSLSRLMQVHMLADLPENPKVATYLPRGRIVALRHGLQKHKDGWARYEMMDLVHTERWSFASGTETLTPAPETTVERGVWETFAETVHLVPTQTNLTRESAHEQLSAAKSLTATTSNDSLKLLPSGDSNAWWRIDKTTGTTLGMLKTANATGGAELTSELLQFYITLGISATFAVVGSALCIDGGGSWGCCIAANGTLMWLGAMFALPIGAIGMGVTYAGYGAAGTLIGSAGAVAIDLGMTQVSVNCK